MARTVLAIDDIPANLLLIEAFLPDYTVISMEEPRAALAYLRNGGRADLILLDRMMPDLDGISFMREAKALPNWGRLPVIMQTAAASAEQIAEGLEAGVYYYLVKPFPEKVLRAVVKRALSDFELYEESRAELDRNSEALKKLKSARFEFRTMDGVMTISSLIASLCPSPNTALLGIRELMLNAVEHGNLGITYAEKTELVELGAWQAEIERRLALPENATKFAVVTVEQMHAEIVLTIEDKGEGFDWRPYMRYDLTRALDLHGRGIFMAKTISFDEMQYEPPGNRVICRKSRLVAGP